MGEGEDGAHTTGVGDGGFSIAVSDQSVLTGDEAGTLGGVGEERGEDKEEKKGENEYGFSIDNRRFMISEKSKHCRFFFWLA